MDRAPEPHPATPQPHSQRRGPVPINDYPVRTIKPEVDNQKPQNQYYGAEGSTGETIETNGDIAALYRYLDNQDIDKKELAELAGIHEDSVNDYLASMDSIGFKIPMLYKKIYDRIKGPIERELIKRGLTALILKTARLKKQGRFGEIAEAMLLNGKVEVSMNINMPIILAPTKNSAANIELSGDEKEELERLREENERLRAELEKLQHIVESNVTLNEYRKLYDAYKKLKEKCGGAV